MDTIKELEYKICKCSNDIKWKLQQEKLRKELLAYKQKYL